MYEGRSLNSRPNLGGMMAIPEELMYDTLAVDILKEALKKERKGCRYDANEAYELDQIGWTQNCYHTRVRRSQIRQAKILTAIDVLEGRVRLA